MARQEVAHAIEQDFGHFSFKADRFFCGLNLTEVCGAGALVAGRRCSAGSGGWLIDAALQMKTLWPHDDDCCSNAPEQ
jgi:hypothetical protein